MYKEFPVTGSKMIELQIFSVSYPLYLSQFRTSEISGYTRILLRAIQKRAELAALRQQHFLYQRKIVYNPISLRSSSGETDTEDNHRQFFPYWSFLFLFQLHRTLLWVVWRVPGEEKEKNK